MALAAGARIADATRGHWAVDNSLHWTLDVTYREDESRTRTDHGPENFATLRRLALVRLDTTVKTRVKIRRVRAGGSHDELLRILQAVFASQRSNIS